MAFYIGEMKKVRNSFFEAYKDGDYKKAIVLGNKLLQIYAENDSMALLFIRKIVKLQ